MFEDERAILLFSVIACIGILILIGVKSHEQSIPDPECPDHTVEIQNKNGIEYVEVLDGQYLVRRGPGGSPEIVGSITRFYPEFESESE